MLTETLFTSPFLFPQSDEIYYFDDEQDEYGRMVEDEMLRREFEEKQRQRYIDRLLEKQLRHREIERQRQMRAYEQMMERKKRQEAYERMLEEERQWEAYQHMLERKRQAETMAYEQMLQRQRQRKAQEAMKQKRAFLDAGLERQLMMKEQKKKEELALQLLRDLALPRKRRQVLKNSSTSGNPKLFQHGSSCLNNPFGGNIQTNSKNIASPAKINLNPEATKDKNNDTITKIESTMAVADAKLINKAQKSSVLIGDVEDVPFEEWEGDRPDSIWNNRRPSDGNWMEPVEGYKL